MSAIEGHSNRRARGVTFNANKATEPVKQPTEQEEKSANTPENQEATRAETRKRRLSLPTKELEQLLKEPIIKGTATPQLTRKGSSTRLRKITHAVDSKNQDKSGKAENVPFPGVKLHTNEENNSPFPGIPLKTDFNLPKGRNSTPNVSIKVTDHATGNKSKAIPAITLDNSKSDPFPGIPLKKEGKSSPRQRESEKIAHSSPNVSGGVLPVRNDSPFPGIPLKTDANTMEIGNKGKRKGLKQIFNTGFLKSTMQAKFTFTDESSDSERSTPSFKLSNYKNVKAIILLQAFMRTSLVTLNLSSFLDSTKSKAALDVLNKILVNENAIIDKLKVVQNYANVLKQPKKKPGVPSLSAGTFSFPPLSPCSFLRFIPSFFPSLFFLFSLALLLYCPFTSS